MTTQKMNRPKTIVFAIILLLFAVGCKSPTQQEARKQTTNSQEKIDRKTYDTRKVKDVLKQLDILYDESYGDDDSDKDRELSTALKKVSDLFIQKEAFIRENEGDDFINQLEVIRASLASGNVESALSELNIAQEDLENISSPSLENQIVDALEELSEAKKDIKLMHDEEATSDEEVRLLADLLDLTNTLKLTQEVKSADASYSNVCRSSSKKIQNLGSPHSIDSDSSSKQTGLLIGGAIVLGLMVLVLVVSSSDTQVAEPANSLVAHESHTLGSIPYGKALFKSGRNGKIEVIGVALSVRTTTNGNITYDAQWADGYKSSYVFWKYGRAMIFSKNGVGKIKRTKDRYRKDKNGDCVITADTSTVATFPDFIPKITTRKH